MKALVEFVGAGPGAEDLITVRGLRALEQADLVVYAGSLVNPAHLPLPNQMVVDTTRTSPEDCAACILAALSAEKNGIPIRPGGGAPISTTERGSL